ncbi:MAG: pyruvate dehydrogenase complex dihydrolipoamide acetyltransferase [Alphaproteobacteria bacterium]|nr:pyruvate dehydrogenase complex dihydrolipoamide acetyltransferase [Alphaproteobacteria bacterium]
MPINITMPALSPTMEEGKLAKWLVKEGDAVTSGDLLAEIETDKATMEVEAVDEGTVGKILIAEGTDAVKVNEVIAVLLEEGEDASAISAAPAAAIPAPVPAAPAAEESAASAAAPAAAPAPAASSGARVFASPLAKRIAGMEGIDISAVSGSGPHGRIVKRDVEAALASGVAAPQAAAPAAAPAAKPALAPGMADDAVLRMYSEGSYEVAPHDGMRRIIAERLTEAKQTIPHFYLSVDVQLDALLALRAEINGRATAGPDGKPGYKVSVNDFVIKAMGAALQQVPDANVTWTDGGMLHHKGSDVGVAVAIPGGLLTPVVRNVEAKGLAKISNEMKDFAARARDRKLMPEEYQGGTTAVSNLGMFGIKDFSAVINPPHATILAVGAGEKRTVISGDEIKIATIMTITLSTDHRAVDGALGAQFLTAIKNNLEHPAMMLV